MEKPSEFREAFFVYNMWFIINIIQLVLIIIATVVSILIALPPAIVGFPAVSYWLARNLWAPWLLLIVGGRVVVHGKENIVYDRACIYSANHASNFDIPALCVAIPLALHFIAKKELKKIPLFGWIMIAMRMIFIDRKNKIAAVESMKKGGELIKKGNNVLTFPEGTRSRSGEIGMFRKGTFIIAQESAIDIVPVAIIGSRKLHKPGGISMRPGKVHVVIGEVMAATDYKDKTPEDFANDAQKNVIAMMENFEHGVAQ